MRAHPFKKAAGIALMVATVSFTAQADFVGNTFHKGSEVFKSRVDSVANSHVPMDSVAVSDFSFTMLRPWKSNHVAISNIGFPWIQRSVSMKQMMPTTKEAKNFIEREFQLWQQYRDQFLVVKAKSGAVSLVLIPLANGQYEAVQAATYTTGAYDYTSPDCVKKTHAKATAAAGSITTFAGRDLMTYSKEGRDFYAQNMHKNISVDLNKVLLNGKSLLSQVEVASGDTVKMATVFEQTSPKFQLN